MEKRLKPLGVILCGGESSRMGSDKSLLNYHGVSQREHVKKLLKPFCSGVVLSVGDREEPLEESFSDIDPFKGNGPISGLLTVHDFFPHRDLLVVACDYPLIRQEDVAQLLASETGDGRAIVFINSLDGMPEPLIGLYPASFCRVIKESWEKGEQSLRRILLQNGALTLSAEDPRLLLSADNPEQAEAAREIIRSGIFTFV